MKSTSQLVVLVVIVAVLLPCTIGLPTRHRKFGKYVKDAEPSQKTGDYIVLLKEGRAGKAVRGPNFMNVMYQGILNYVGRKDDNSEEVIVRRFQDLGFFMYSVEMNEVALKKVLKCRDVAMVEEDSLMMTPSKTTEEEESSGYGDDSFDDDEDGGGIILFG